MSREYAVGCFAALNSRCVLLCGGFLTQGDMPLWKKTKACLKKILELTPARQVGLHPPYGNVYSIRNHGSKNGTVEYIYIRVLMLFFSTR